VEIAVEKVKEVWSNDIEFVHEQMDATINNLLAQPILIKQLM
jgi:hypothetical protein